MNKPYDYLDHRNVEYDNDFKTFLANTEQLRQNIAEAIERNFDSVWETPQGIRFLTRFEKVIFDISVIKINNRFERISDMFNDYLE